jgi:hypothetical protein
MKTKATQQITEITFNEDMNPFISKYLADKAVGNCDYLKRINVENGREFEEKIEKEFRLNPESPDESKIAEWQQGLNRAELQAKEWDEAGNVIIRQIMAVYPDYQIKKPQVKRADLVAEAKARFASK